MQMLEVDIQIRDQILLVLQNLSMYSEFRQHAHPSVFQVLVSKHLDIRVLSFPLVLSIYQQMDRMGKAEMLCRNQKLQELLLIPHSSFDQVRYDFELSNLFYPGSAISRDGFGVLAQQIFVRLCFQQEKGLALDLHNQNKLMKSQQEKFRHSFFDVLFQILAICSV